VDHQPPQTETADAPPKQVLGETFSPGSLVDHFKVIRLVGRGGMGEVYLARDTRLGRKVALKVIQPDRLGSKRAVKQFVQEARATATFSHPHIVTIHTTGEHEGRPYVALEYLEGNNLRHRMEEHPPSLRETLRLGLAIASALAEAHGRHILHRDLKPENVVLPKDGRLRVVDFGLAKLIKGAAFGETSTPQLTDVAREGVDVSAETASLPDTQAPMESLVKGVRGTPEYMAPEQWKDQPITPAVDIWALGVMLFELVSGQRPYGEASFFALAFKVGADEPTPPLPNASELPTDVVELIRACLDKDPKERPTGQEVGDSLQGMITAWGRSEDAAGEANPFRGLQPFTEEHADLFFGRDAEVSAFVERLREESVLPVVGPSGAGKSSFVQAGVIPRLREQGPWTVLQIRPGRRPFRALAHRLLAGEPRRGTAAHALPSLTAHGNAANTDVARYSREDVALCTAVDDPLSPVRVIFTLRDDFMVRLALGTAAREALSHVTVLRRPEPENLQETIRSPVERLGYRFDDPTLVSEMVEQVEGEPACLPLLQFTASLLWERRDRAKRLLCRRHHEAIGGVAGALARNADGVLDELSGVQPKLAREILLRLVTAEGTRRVIPRAQVLDGLDLEAGTEVLNRLVKGRLLTVRRGWQEEGEEAELELVHESLVTTWARLARWIDESREDLTFLSEVGNAADQWHRRGRNDEELWHGERLHEAMRSRSRCTTRVPQRVTDFIETGLQRERLIQRRRKVIWAVAFAVVIVAAVFLFGQMRRAQRQQRVAEDQRAKARQRWAEAQREGARAALMQGEMLEARAKLRGSLEQEDSLLARALWWRLGRHPLRWSTNLGATAFALAFSPDGKTLAAANSDGVIFLRDLQHHRTKVLRGGGVQINTLAFSPSGLQLAAGFSTGVARIWNLERNTSLRLQGHRQAVWRSTFSPDGRTLATASSDRTVALWDVASGAERLRLPAHGHPVFGLAYAPDGKRIFTGDLLDNTVRIWSADSGAPLGTMAPDRTESGSCKVVPNRSLRGCPGIYDLAVAPDGRTLAVAETRGAVRLWDLSTRRQQAVLHGHTAAVYHVVFSGKSGRQLISADMGGMVRRWDPDAGKELDAFRAHDRTSFGLAMHPGGSLLGTGAKGGEVRLWDLSLSLPPPPEGHGDHVSNVVFSPDGKTLASSGRDRMIRLWDRRSGKQVRQLKGHTDAVRGLAFGPGERTRIIGDGAREKRSTWLASVSSDRTLRIWDTVRGTQARLVQSSGGMDCVVFHPSGSRVAAVGNDRYVRIWDLSSLGQPRVLGGHTEVVNCVAFSPDGQTLASAGYDKTIRIWRTASGQPVRTLEGHAAEIKAVALSPSGETLASADRDGEIRMWNLIAGKHRVLGRHPGRIHSLTFHPRGALLGTSHADGTGRIWRIGDGSYTALRGHRADANDLAFSPDGEAVATTSDDGTVRLWDPASGRPIWRTTVLLAAPPRLLTHMGWQTLMRAPSPGRDALAAPLRLRLERSAYLGVEATPSRVRPWHSPGPAGARSNRRRVCLATHAGQLELWERGASRPLFSKLVTGVRRLVALSGGGCARPLPALRRLQVAPPRRHGARSVRRRAAGRRREAGPLLRCSWRAAGGGPHQPRGHGLDPRQGPQRAAAPWDRGPSRAGARSDRGPSRAGARSDRSPAGPRLQKRQHRARLAQTRLKGPHPPLHGRPLRRGDTPAPRPHGHPDRRLRQRHAGRLEPAGRHPPVPRAPARRAAAPAPRGQPPARRHRPGPAHDPRSAGLHPPALRGAAPGLEQGPRGLGGRLPDPAQARSKAPLQPALRCQARASARAACMCAFSRATSLSSACASSGLPRLQPAVSAAYSPATGARPPAQRAGIAPGVTSTPNPAGSS